MEGQHEEGWYIIPGYRFAPEEHDLLLYYLTPKINGDPLPWDGIREFDVYGKGGPWEIIHGRTSSEAYVFATSKNKSLNMKQRTCDFGTWKQQMSCPVQHQGQTIGTGTYLSFDPKVGVDPAFLGGSWNMTEYCLKGHEKKEGHVICKVSFKVWTARERAKKGLDQMPDGACSDVVDAARPRKRATTNTEVAYGSNAAGAGSDIHAAPATKKAKIVAGGSSSSNPACAPYPSYPNCVAGETTNLDHCSSTNTVEEQAPGYGVSYTPDDLDSYIVLADWDTLAPAACTSSSYEEDNIHLNLANSNDYNPNVVNTQQEDMAAGLDPCLQFKDHGNFVDSSSSNNGAEQSETSSAIVEDPNYSSSSNNGAEQPETSSAIVEDPNYSSSSNNGAEQPETSSALVEDPINCSNSNDWAQQLGTSSVVEYPAFYGGNSAVNFGLVTQNFLASLTDNGQAWLDEFDDDGVVPQDYCILGDGLWSY